MGLENAVITCTETFIGGAPVIRLSGLPSNATHCSVYYAFGSQGATIVNRKSVALDGTVNIMNFYFPLSFYNEIPNYTTGSGTILADIYENSYFLGTINTPFNVYVNYSTSKPTISLPTVTNDGAISARLTGNNNTIIRYISLVNVAITAEAKNAATLDDANITTVNGSSSFSGRFGEFLSVEVPKFQVRAKDSRGLETTISYTLPAERFIEYIKLTCNAGNEERPDTSGAMRLSCSGNYFNASFGAVNNSLIVEYRYKADGGAFGSWEQMTATISDNTYSAYADITGLDYRTNYIFECRAKDAAMTAIAQKTAQSTPVFHWSKDNFTFEVPVTFKKGASGAVEAGQWTPTLTTAAAVSSYSTQSGWYVRCGNVVTIGFNIGASCKSGYNSTALAISGLPFKPAVSAFGGGVMFGAYVNAGFCFEAWAATTGGQITPRLQPCNNTTAGNLQIASTAYYPSGANSLTLGGTITYITND